MTHNFNIRKNPNVSDVSTSNHWLRKKNDFMIH